MAKRVLVVEDDDVNRKLFVSLLEEKGYEVAEAADGMEALEKIREGAPSMVLLDIVLPKMSGFEVLRRCRESGLLKNTSVYALTASTMSEIGDAGFSGIITKPIRVAEFLRAVDEALGSGRWEEARDQEDTHS